MNWNFERGIIPCEPRSDYYPNVFNIKYYEYYLIQVFMRKIVTTIEVTNVQCTIVKFIETYEFGRVW